jgi:hypothetical protein
LANEIIVSAPNNLVRSLELLGSDGEAASLIVMVFHNFKQLFILRTDGQTHGQTDEQRHGQTDGQTDEQRQTHRRVDGFARISGERRECREYMTTGVYDYAWCNKGNVAVSYLLFCESATLRVLILVLAELAVVNLA